MNNLQYTNTFSEVLEILKYVSKDNYEKIPLEMIEIMEDYSNKNYHVIYNPKLSLSDQNFSKEAKTMIAIFFRDYWASDRQKQIILDKEICDNYIENLEKEKEYNCDVFQNNTTDNNLDNINANNTTTNQIEVLKKINWFENIILKVKKIFKI